MIIYLDIVLLENLFMNYIILFTTAVITKTRMKLWRLFISSFIGGIYATISFVPILEIYSNLVLKILLSIVMIYIAFHSKTIKMLFKQLIIFYLVSFVFGGIAFALLYFIRPQDILMKNGLFVGTYPIKIAFLGATIGFLIVQIAFKVIKTRMKKKDLYCEIEIYLNNHKQVVKAMIDSGNSLREPITKSPVIIVEASELMNFIPETILKNIDEIINGNINDIDDTYISKFRLIPFTSIGKENGLLLGIKTDYIIIKMEEEIKEEKNVILGIYSKQLNKNNSYHALIGLELLERKTNEYITNFKT